MRRTGTRKKRSLPITPVKLTPLQRDKVRAVVDNHVFFDLEGAAQWLQVRTDAVLDAVQRGSLAPAGMTHNGKGGYVFTHRDLERYRNLLGLDAEKRVVEMLQAGAHPVDAYLAEYRNGIKMRKVLQLTHEWADLTGTWVIEGPPGSYARWLERMGLMQLKPRYMRRIIEAILTDAHTNNVVREKLKSIALETSQPSSARGEEPHVSE